MTDTPLTGPATEDPALTVDVSGAPSSVPEPVSGLPDGSQPSLPEDDADDESQRRARGGSPLQLFAAGLNAWHRGALASARLTVAGIRALADQAGLALDLEPEARLTGKRGIPSASGERCVRCGRRLQFVHRLNGAPFGRICLSKELRG